MNGNAQGVLFMINIRTSSVTFHVTDEIPAMVGVAFGAGD